MAVVLASLPEVLRLAGLEVELFPGYETRSRSTGPYPQVRLIGVHHDAIAAHVPEINRSRAGWTNTSNPNRPVGAVRLNKDGKVVIGSLMATNTQGRGGPYPSSKGWVPKDQGNLYTFSIEPSNDGIGEPWPLVQQEAYITLCAAVMLYTGLTPGDVIAHFEWSPGRKADPAGPSMFARLPRQLWNMDAFRGSVWLRSLDLIKTGRAYGRPASKPPVAPVVKPMPLPAPKMPPFNPERGEFSLWPLASKPDLRVGAQGDAVRYLQGVLNKDGARITVDGRFGSQETAPAVAAFQRRHGLKPDEWVGKMTWAVVDRVAGAKAPVAVPTKPPPAPMPPFNPERGQFSLWPIKPDKPDLRVGARGDAVRYLQGVLNKGGARIAVDGHFGSQETAPAVAAFQRRHGLKPDEWVGKMTWAVVDRVAG